MFVEDSHLLCHRKVAHYNELDLYLLSFNQLQTAFSVTILSLEASICTTVRSKEAKKLKSLHHDSHRRRVGHLEGSIAELSLALWTLGPWLPPHQVV